MQKQWLVCRCPSLAARRVQSVAADLGSTDLLLGDNRTLVRVRRHGPGHPAIDADRHRHDAAVPSDEAEVSDRLDRVLNVLTSSLGRLDVAE